MAASHARDPGAADRKREIVRIHVLRAALKLPEDEYRDLLGNLFDGKRSSTELDAAQRQRLIRQLELLERQHAGHGPAGTGRAKATRRPKSGLPPLTPRQRKMFSLWQRLADASLVRERGMPALKDWVVRQTGVDRWEWLNSHQEDTVIESLKRWLARGRDSSDGGAAHV